MGRNGQLTMPVVMMSGHATIDTAVEATRIGALDFLEKKPIGLAKLLATVKRAVNLVQEAPRPVVTLSKLGESEHIRELTRMLQAAQTQNAPVLLIGPPGVGFEFCGRYMTPDGKPFVAPFSNEEFALAPQELLNKASGGTLFLRDLAYLDTRAQAGLKSVLGKLEKMKVRLVSASSRPLDQLSGDLDPELFRQLSQWIVPVPGLREHKEDIPRIAESILADTVAQHKLGPRRFSHGALQLLAQQDWPGNLDELTNVVKSLALSCRDGEIDINPVSRILSQFSPGVDGVAAQIAAPAPALSAVDMNLPLREARDQFEKYYLERQIELSGGNMSRVAERIGLERTHLYRKLKQLGVTMPKKKNKVIEED